VPSVGPEAEDGHGPPGFRLAQGAQLLRRVEAGMRVRAAAVADHESQTTNLIADDPEGFRLEPAMIDRLCGPYERFVAVPA
ncbi:hypothetical protein OMR07_19280, partial [Methylobacterium organophilum]|nr:hypothetical protein [Methylobacterium organophilum]